MNIKNKQKIILVTILCSSAVLAFVLMIPDQALANPLASAASGLLATISEGMMRAIAYILNETIAKLFTNLMQFQNFFTTGVNAGWEVTRDFANLIFALVLLFIAIATVLSVGPLDSYSYKRMLPPFIFAALSINFSKAIVGVLIDISQIIMIEFYNAIAGAGGLFNSIAAISMYNSTVSGTSGTNPAPYITAIIVMLILVFVLLWTSIILVSRIVTLWLVIMTAPLAFVSFAVPPMKGIWKQWVENLQSSLTVGPVLMFYLYLSLRVFEAATLGEGFDPLNYALVIVLIFMSNMQAQKAASSAPGFAKKAVAFVGGAAVGAATLGLFHRREIAEAAGAVAGVTDKTIRGSAKTVDIAGSVFGKDPLLAQKYDLAKENMAAKNAAGKGMFGQFGQEVFGGKEAKENMRDTARTWQAINTERAVGKELSPQQAKILAAKEAELTSQYKNIDDSNLLTQKFKSGDQLEKTAALKELLDRGDIDTLLEDPEYKKKYVEPYATTAASIAAIVQDELNINQNNVTDYDRNLLAGIERKNPELAGLRKVIDSKVDTSQPDKINALFNNNITFESFASDDTESAVGKLKADMLRTRKQVDGSSTNNPTYEKTQQFSTERLDTFMDQMGIDNQMAANPNTWKKLKLDIRREMEQALKESDKTNKNAARYEAVLQGIQGGRTAASGQSTSNKIPT